MTTAQDIIKKLLSEIVKSKPDFISTDYKWLIETLKERYYQTPANQDTDCNKEINGLANCLSWGIVDDIRQSYSKTLDISDAKNILRQLVRDYGQQEDLARWCLDSWCNALGKIVDISSISALGFHSQNPFTKNLESKAGSFSEETYKEVVIETIKNRELDIALQIELTVKGKQLGLSDVQIENIFKESKQLILEYQKKAEELIRLDLIEKEHEKLKAIEQQKEAERRLIRQKQEEERKKIEQEKQLSIQEAQRIELEKKEKMLKEDKENKNLLIRLAIGGIIWIIMWTIKTCSEHNLTVQQELNNPSVKTTHSQAFNTSNPPDNWPMYRHDPQHTGYSINAGPINNNILWSSDIPNISTSPVIDKKGNIYVGNLSGDFAAINKRGKVIWKYKTGYTINSTPAIDEDGTIYFGSWDCYFYALQPNGKLKWKYKADNQIWSSPNFGLDNTIFFGCDDGNLYALNKEGKLQWKFKTDAEIHSSPAVDNENLIYFGSNDSNLYAIDSKGELVWKFKTGDRIESSPNVASYSVIYVGSSDHYLYAINRKGELVWKFKTEYGISSSPSLGAYNRIYVGGNDNYFYIINSDGSLSSKFKTDGVIRSSPAVDAEGNIYFGSWDGYIYALDLNISLLWKYKTNDQVDSSPAIGNNGIVYFVSDKLYAFGHNIK